MSTYYEYKDVKVMMAHKLMNMEGWTVFGYHADESDSMTDYYSPAYWDGIATKNGYVLVVDNSSKTEAKEIRQYNRTTHIIDNKTKETIKKLEALTMDRGASEQEEQTAKEKIELLKNKTNENNSNIPAYEVVGIIPAHEANPPRCNWHIEKDGVIVLKGSGILKYSSVDSYFRYDHYKKSYDLYKKSPSDWIKDNAEGLYHRGYSVSMEKATEEAQRNIKSIEKDALLIDEFYSFIQKIDSTCGGILGTGDLVTYEKVIVTEYKTENKAVETTTGSIKEGQCFILKSNFSYGCFKGLVYRIHEVEEKGKKYYHAYKLNGKLTKECTGKASQNNYWFIGSGEHDNITKWINKGSIAWCNIEEVKTPYEVEKVVKKVIKAETETTEQPKKEKKTEQPEQATTELVNLTYDIKEDIDTRDNSKIYVVKVIEKLSKDDYIIVNNNMKSLGGYYSKFKHGFIFKVDPTELLNNNIKQEETNTKEQDIAEIIEDYSTEIIEALHLTPSECATNGEYINRLSAKISHLKITEKVINCIEYDGLKQAIKNILQAKEQQAKQDQKQNERQQLTEKINKQIKSIQKKIDELSGEYKTNTWKRMNEQASRDSKIEGYKKDIELLQYLIDTIENRGLTPLEENLIILSFRNEIYSYYIRHNAYLEKKGTALKEINFPEINREYPDSWINKEVPTKQKRLQKANIYNTSDLLKSVDEYKVIYDLINKPCNYSEKKIKQLEREYKMQQKGDINFTPLKVVEQMIQYAHIDNSSRVLEPSAGIGNIADQIRKVTKNLDVCEQMYHFSELLKLKGHNIVGNDFLEYETGNKYDAIIMNPPFSDEQNHIKHAYDLLKDDGILVAISSPHWTFANDKKSIEFRQWLENETYFTNDLPSGTFEMTGVSSKIIIIEKHEQSTVKTA